MAEARAYQCPVCGAFARARERSCRHCATALATLRCAHCFELNFPDALHCGGCGGELGLEPIPEHCNFSCPDCRVELKSFTSGSARLYACERCGAQMVMHELLRDLLEQRAVLGHATLEAPAARERPNPLSQPVRYRPCPMCSQIMHRRNFGGTSGIIIDVCSLHGSLFDAGELPRVLDFVRRGGLARAQQRELEQAKEAARSQRVRAGTPIEPVLSSGEQRGLDLTGAALELLDVVVSLVTRR
jgi:Zn-finger nucleic acid-binding protein